MFPNLTVWFCPAPAAPESPSPLTLQPPCRMRAPPKPFCPGSSSTFCPLAHRACSRPFLLGQGPPCGCLPITLSVGLPLLRG